MENTTFSIDKFDIKLDTTWIGRNFFYLDELGSTNSYLLDKENDLSIDGTVVLAEKQTHGRGRLDRQWYSAKSQNLTFSILLTKMSKYGKKINLLNLGASLVVAQTIENLFQLKTELKWPNDVLINGNKVAGILLESVSFGSKISRIVFGIGLNVNQIVFQGDYRIQPTSIRFQTGQPIEREKLLAELLNNFEEMLIRFKIDSNFIVREWREKCKMLNEKISIEQGDKTKYGFFEDIDELGFMLLQTEDGLEKISFGDVSVV